MERMSDASWHEHWIKQCTILARNGINNVGNGALVGAILVSKNTIIDQDFHAAFGAPHAERALLERYRGPIQPSDILYVNLEPCCHQGKTPPCTESIVRRGVKRVCYGMVDPDPRVAGKGIAALRGAGIEVIGPVGRAACEYVNRGFLSVRTKGRPWIVMKEARTQDGRIAKPDGSPLAITNGKQDAWTHTFLRARQDAILVGVETIVKDNPILNTRLAQSFQQQYSNDQPWRVILDPHLRVPSTAGVVTDDARSSTIIITGTDLAQSAVAEQLRKRGVHVWGCAMEGRAFALAALWRCLLAPTEGFNGLTSVLVEGGRRTWELFQSAGVVDEEVTLIGSE